MHLAVAQRKRWQYCTMIQQRPITQFWQFQNADIRAWIQAVEIAEMRDLTTIFMRLDRLEF
jgi:hypothetical protein